jgi:hypothetical protein
LKKKSYLFATLFLGFIGYAVYELTSGEPERSLSSNTVVSNYSVLSACEKQAILWDHIVGTEHQTLPEMSALGPKEFVYMTLQKIQRKKDYDSDFSPAGWQKYLHKRGAIAKVAITKKGDHPYTGVFEGAECALLRLSLTYKPSNKKAVAPGLALKVLRDNMSSANVSALYSIDGQGFNYNFFANDLSNIAPKTEQRLPKLMHLLFRKVTRYPEELLVDDFAKYSEHGEKVESSKAPRQIFFVPNKDLKFSAAPHEVRSDFLTIPSGTLIYTVYALSDKYRDHNYDAYKDDDIKGFLANSVAIAEIHSTSEFIASEFGDVGIFFKHEIRP